MNNKTQTAIDVYSLVTNQIIGLLEAGTIPWRQTWKDGILPMNLISKRPYRGINLMLLSSLGYEHNLFLTWKQLKTVSASVKRGEKGHMVVFSKMHEKTKEDGSVERRSLLRYYRVFNVLQCTDIPKAFFADLPTFADHDFEPVERCASILSDMKDAPKLQHKKNEAYYNPALDIINMPKQSSFESSEEYYGTLFHELIHATGHAKRLNRKEIADNPKFGSEQYSIEELVAEVGACYLKCFTGLPIDDLTNNAAYIDHWLGVLKADKRFIIKAASRSQQAVEYILKTGSDTKEPEEAAVSEDVLG